jgi:hypothetical protein
MALQTLQFRFDGNTYEVTSEATQPDKVIQVADNKHGLRYLDIDWTADYPPKPASIDVVRSPGRRDILFATKVS